MPFDLDDVAAARRLARGLPELARAEAELARAELAARKRAFGACAILMIVGAALSLTALNMLAGAAVAALAAEGVAPELAMLAVGGAGALIAALLLWCGARAASRALSAPHRVARSLRRDLDLVKETFQ